MTAKDTLKPTSDDTETAGAEGAAATAAPAADDAADVASRRDVLSAAFDTAEDAADAAEEAAEEAGAAAPAAKGRARDATGKFVSKGSGDAKSAPDGAGSASPAPGEPGKDAATAAASPPATEAAADQAAAPAATVDADGVADGPVRAPDHWSAEDKALIEGLPEEARDPVLKLYTRMEGDYTRNMQEIRPTMKAIEPYRPYFEAIRATPEQALTIMLTSEAKLRTGTLQQRLAHFQQLGRDYGLIAKTETYPGIPGMTADIPPGLPADAQAGDATYGAVGDPDVLARLNAVESQIQYSSEAVRTQKVNEINAMAIEKDVDGSLKYPHFDDVVPQMTGIAQGLRSAGQAIPAVEQLYHMAVQATPSVAKLVNDARQSQSDTAAKEQAKERAAKARKASKGVKGSPPMTTITPTKPGDRRSTIEAAYDEHEDA